MVTVRGLGVVGATDQPYVAGGSVDVTTLTQYVPAGKPLKVYEPLDEVVVDPIPLDEHGPEPRVIVTPEKRSLVTVEV